MVKVENLIALYNIGHAAGQVKGIALHPAATPFSILSVCGRVARTLRYAEGAPSSGSEGGSWVWVLSSRSANPWEASE